MTKRVLLTGGAGLECFSLLNTPVITGVNYGKNWIHISLV